MRVNFSIIATNVNIFFAKVTVILDHFSSYSCNVSSMGYLMHWKVALQLVEDFVNAFPALTYSEPKIYDQMLLQ